MARLIPLQIMSGTRAQVEAAKIASDLLPRELYLITDESVLAVGTATNAYVDIARADQFLRLTGGALSGNLTIARDGQAAYTAAGYSDTLYSAMTLRRARGTQAAPSGLLANDFMAAVLGQGLDSGGAFRNGAVLLVQAADDFTPSGCPTRLLIQVIPPGAVSPATVLQIRESGNVLVGTNTDDGSSKIQAAGDVNLTAGGTLRQNGADALTPLQEIAARLVAPIKPITGRYYDQSIGCTTSSTIAGAAGRIDLSAYCVPQDFAVDRLGVNVTTLIASALGRVVVYASDANGQPATRVFQGASQLDFSTTGLKEHVENFTFLAGVQYWIGLHSSSTATVSGIAVGFLPSLGFLTGNATSYCTCIRQTATFASGAPASFGFNAASHLTANVVVPSIRMRAA